MPDILASIAGRFVGIEVKRPGRLGGVSELQKAHIRMIWAAEGEAYVVDSLEAVIEIEERLSGKQNKEP